MGIITLIMHLDNVCLIDPAALSIHDWQIADTTSVQKIFTALLHCVSPPPPLFWLPLSGTTHSREVIYTLKEDREVLIFTHYSNAHRIHMLVTNMSISVCVCV